MPVLPGSVRNASEWLEGTWRDCLLLAPPQAGSVTLTLGISMCIASTPRGGVRMSAPHLSLQRRLNHSITLHAREQDGLCFVAGENEPLRGFPLSQSRNPWFPSEAPSFPLPHPGWIQMGVVSPAPRGHLCCR